MAGAHSLNSQPWFWNTSGYSLYQRVMWNAKKLKIKSSRRINSFSLTIYFCVPLGMDWVVIIISYNEDICGTRHVRDIQ